MSGSVTFSYGASTVAVAVNPYQDSFVEGDETVVVSLSSGSCGSGGYTAGTPSSATVTSADAPIPEVTVSATDANASEVGPDSGEFTFSRTGDTTNALTVTYMV